jgi:hypothetical protein
MRPSLLNRRGDRRHHPRRGRPRPALTAAAHAGPAAPACDPDIRRAREAGGPVDRASYVCACGYLFSASVSTSVICPHCGADQAW